MVTEVRGMGYFYALELGKDGEQLSDEEQDWLLQSFLNRRLPELGLICRVDDLGPAIGLSPPLIAGPAEFEEITAIIRQGLEQAWRHVESGDLEVENRSTKRMPPATA
jgi:adenosylmethionine-8-amino-7-oxononanoate aminotransferase